MAIILKVAHALVAPITSAIALSDLPPAFSLRALSPHHPVLITLDVSFPNYPLLSPPPLYSLCSITSALSPSAFPTHHLLPSLSLPTPAPSVTTSSPKTLLAAINSPPHHPPSPLTYSACTAVIPNKFSVSAKCAFSCASCACRCVYCLLRFVWDWERDRGCWVGLDWRDEERERVVGVWVGKEAVLMEADIVGVVVVVVDVVIGESWGDGWWCLTEVGRDCLKGKNS